jgi:FkbM family methyltransferase
MEIVRIGELNIHALSKRDPYVSHLRASHPTESTRFLNLLETIKTTTGLHYIADIGANIGYTSLVASHAFPETKIYAFEPGKDTYECLCNNTDCKGSQITPVNIAVSDRAGKASFIENSAYGSLCHPDREPEESIIVDQTTLSRFAKDNDISRFDIAKIDVEGFELDVINGLAGACDLIYFEFNPWAICFNYRKNPLEVLEEIGRTWRILRYQHDTILEEHPIAKLAHDVIAFKSLDDFVATRKGSETDARLPRNLRPSSATEGGISDYSLMLNRIYHSLLNRDADESGTRHFLGKYGHLAAAEFSKKVESEIMQSTEFRLRKQST